MEAYKISRSSISTFFEIVKDMIISSVIILNGTERDRRTVQ